MKDTGQCRLKFAKKPCGLNRAAIQNAFIFLSTGFVRWGYRRSFLRPNWCSEPLTTNINCQTKLSLNHVSSANLLLGVCLAASLLIFLLELILARALRHRQTVACHNHNYIAQ